MIANARSFHNFPDDLSRHLTAITVYTFRALRICLTAERIAVCVVCPGVWSLVGIPNTRETAEVIQNANLIIVFCLLSRILITLPVFP